MTSPGASASRLRIAGIALLAVAAVAAVVGLISLGSQGSESTAASPPPASAQPVPGPAGVSGPAPAPGPAPGAATGVPAPPVTGAIPPLAAPPIVPSGDAGAGTAGAGTGGAPGGTAGGVAGGGVAGGGSGGGGGVSSYGDVPVRVLNNSLIPGLAERAAAQMRAAGWNVVEVGNYSGGVIPTSTVYYLEGSDEQAAARAAASEFGARAEPRFPGIANASRGVIVIATNDWDSGTGVKGG